LARSGHGEDLALPNSTGFHFMRHGITSVIILIAVFASLPVSALPEEPPPPGAEIQYLPLELGFAELERIKRETERFEESRTWGVWDWYWNHNAELVLPPQTGRTEMDWFDKAFSYKFVPLWNEVMKDMAAKVILAVILFFGIGGVSFAAGASLLKNDAARLKLEEQKSKIRDKEVEELLKQVLNQITLVERLQEKTTNANDESEQIEEWLREARAHPDSALAELRRQIEKEIKRLSSIHIGQIGKKPIYELIKLLETKQVLTAYESRTLQDARPCLNDATHVNLVDPKDREFILNIAPGLLRSLKAKN